MNWRKDWRGAVVLVGIALWVGWRIAILLGRVGWHVDDKLEAHPWTW
jgi:hypothetical protein